MNDKDNEINNLEKDEIILGSKKERRKNNNKPTSVSKSFQVDMKPKFANTSKDASEKGQEDKDGE